MENIRVEILKKQEIQKSQIYNSFEKAEQSQEQSKKIEKVMKEFKDGVLTDSHGNKVTDRKQALAIAMSEAKEIEKGKSFPIGTIHNGYKKVKDGVWKKVSEKGMTKKEHKDKLISLENSYRDNMSTKEKQDFSKNRLSHSNSLLKLDDKEYSDEDVVKEKA